jgi:hypothetical protein
MTAVRALGLFVATVLVAASTAVVINAIASRWLP